MPDGDQRAMPGILSGSEILASLGDLLKNGAPECVESCSYDMRVGTIFCERQRINSTSSHHERSIQIQPGEFVYLFTLEEISLPADMCATAYAINGLSSRGLLVLNPGHVDPGFTGPLTVTAWNLNNQPQTIEVGDKVITVLFNRLPLTADPFSRNRSRDDREKDFTKHVSCEATKGIGELIRNNIRSPIATKEDLDAARRDFESSATNRLSLMIGVISIVLALVGLILALYAIFQSGGGNVHQEFHGIHPAAVPALKSPEPEPQGRKAIDEPAVAEPPATGKP